MVCNLQRRIIENELSWMGFLPIQFEATVESEARWQFEKHSVYSWFTSLNGVLLHASFTALKHQNLRDIKTSLVHGSMYDLLLPLHASGRTTFRVRLSTIQTRSYFQILISYFCHIPEENNISAVKHGIAGCKPCTRCTTVAVTVRHLQSDKLLLCPKWY